MFFLFKVAILGIFSLLSIASLLMILGIIIPKNRRFNENAEGVTIYLTSNGYHTDFILPIQQELFNWQPFIDLENYAITNKDTGYLGLGWGDRAIYLDLAEWSELTLKMGLKTLFWPTPPLLHVTAYDKLPMEDKKLKQLQSITLSPNQYLQLCHYILGFFKVDKQLNVQLLKGKGYTPNDNFYEAIGKYHLFNTCNTWVSRGLSRIGVRTAWWTPIDRGIFYQLQKVTPIMTKTTPTLKSQL